jgi:hypothetical protein
MSDVLTNTWTNGGGRSVHVLVLKDSPGKDDWRWEKNGWRAEPASARPFLYTLEEVSRLMAGGREPRFYAVFLCTLEEVSRLMAGRPRASNWLLRCLRRLKFHEWIEEHCVLLYIGECDRPWWVFKRMRWAGGEEAMRCRRTEEAAWGRYTAWGEKKWLEGRIRTFCMYKEYVLMILIRLSLYRYRRFTLD